MKPTQPRQIPPPPSAQFIARTVLLCILLFILSAAFGQRYRVRAVKQDTNAAIVVRREAKGGHKLIPELFSPNGDGFMDAITFGGPEYKWFLADIYNPLGLHILTFRNGQTWDGQGCSMGSYIYIIEAVTLDGDTLYSTGKTFLSR